MGQTATGELTHFPLIGILSVICTFAGISFSRYLRPAVEDPAGFAAASMDGNRLTRALCQSHIRDFCPLNPNGQTP